MKMKQFGLSETKLFHFHRIFKIGGREGGSSELPGPLLDTPLGGCICKWCKRLGRCLLWKRERACVKLLRDWELQLKELRLEDNNIVDGLKVGGWMW